MLVVIGEGRRTWSGAVFGPALFSLFSAIGPMKRFHETKPSVARAYWLGWIGGVWKKEWD